MDIHSKVTGGLPQDSLDDVLAAVAQAETAIMAVYASPATVDVTLKSDDSPLTQADMASHHILTDGLAKLFPGIPVISEEGDERQNKTTVQGDAFWLVDPLDGTKEFIARTDEFTVCIALVRDGVPVFGIIAAPALDALYYGGPGMGSYKKAQGQDPVRIHVAGDRVGVVLGSRSHFEQSTAHYMDEHYKGARVDEVGSQLKFARVAEGLADAYPRFGSTMKLWDVAAGEAILRGAGGSVAHPDGSLIDYHSQTFLVGDFIAKS